MVAQLTVAKSDEMRRSEERSRQESEHASRLKVKLEERERASQALENDKREKQLLALQKERKLQELRDKWVVAEVSSQSAKASRNPEGGAVGAKRKKKSDKAEGGEEGAVFEDKFDSQIDRSTYEGEIDFGSSSDEEGAPQRSARSQIGIDLFGDDDSDEEPLSAAPAADASKEDASKEALPARKRLKRLAVTDQDSDEEGLLGEVEQSTVA